MSFFGVEFLSSWAEAERTSDAAATDRLLVDDHNTLNPAHVETVPSRPAATVPPSG